MTDYDPDDCPARAAHDEHVARPTLACEHGRQRGKCDTCDLLEAQEELARMTRERDAARGELSDARDAVGVAWREDSATLQHAIRSTVVQLRRERDAAQAALTALSGLVREHTALETRYAEARD